MTANEFYASLSGKRITFVGVGRSNLPLIEQFKAHGAAVSVRDKRSEAALGEDGEALKKLGAKLEIHHNTVQISRVRTLSGAKLTARDLRGGAALVLAAMQAEGESRVEGLTHIDRGYERFAEKLRALGADIERISAG